MTSQGGSPPVAEREDADIVAAAAQALEWRTLAGPDKAVSTTSPPIAIKTRPHASSPKLSPEIEWYMNRSQFGMIG
jgi:hypothetical protein